MTIGAPLAAQITVIVHVDVSIPSHLSSLTADVCAADVPSRKATCATWSPARQRYVVMKTLILSDLHLGSKACQAKQLRRFLHVNRFQNIILNGDIIDSCNFERLKKTHWEVLEVLNSIVCSAGTVVLLRGNHDGEYLPYRLCGASLLPRLLGIGSYSDFEVLVGQATYLVMHGDCFDPTLGWPILTDAADWLYQATQSLSRKAAKRLKRWAKSAGGIIECVKRGAVQEAKRRNCQGIITGHTHFADDEWINGVHYLNCGSWTDPHPTYVEIDSDKIRLVEV